MRKHDNKLRRLCFIENPLFLFTIQLRNVDFKKIFLIIEIEKNSSRIYRENIAIFVQNFVITENHFHN